MAEQDGRGSLLEKSNPVLYLPSGQRTYNRAMSSVERPLGQLVKAGHLKEFMVESGNRGPRLGAQQKGNPLSPPLGVIEVIHAVPRGTNTAGMRVSTMASIGDFLEDQPPTKRMKSQLEPIAFDDEDLVGTIQPHDDALVIAARIGGFLVKRVMIDQGSGADVMYPVLGLVPLNPIV